jgi:hypothetical protein
MTEEIKSINLDANQTAFFARELESIKARTYDVVYPELKATTLIPVSTEAGPGAESITYQQFDQLGLAKVIANYADDLPRADVKGKEFNSPIRSLGASYGYSVQEIRAAQFVGRSLEQRKANATRRAIEQKVNKIAWYGDSESGLTGLIDNPNITRVAVENDGTASSTLWEDKTPDQILRDMNDLVTGIVDVTKGVEMPNTLIMPIKQYRQISNTRLASGTDTTILEFFLQNSPFITTVEWVNELKGAGLGEGSVAAGGDVMIAYDRNPDKLTLEIPQPYEQFPAQERGLEFVVPAHARVAGVIIYYPLSVAVGEGI